MRAFLLLLLSLLVGCGGGSQKLLRVGIDPTWYPIDFGSQTSYVNGYTEDLLLEMAHYSGMEFEIVHVNWDDLLDGLKAKKFDAILTSLPPYEYNQALYDFSLNTLDLGPVLIVPVNGGKESLEHLKGELVGLLTNDSAVALLEKYPEILIRNYSSIPELLNAVVTGDVEAALLNRIPAVNFVGDLYAGRLKIAGDPMTKAGLHLVAPKGRLQKFNRTLESLQKKKTVEMLLKKWGFSLT